MTFEEVKERQLKEDTSEVKDRQPKKYTEGSLYKDFDVSNVFSKGHFCGLGEVKMQACVNCDKI